MVSARIHAHVRADKRMFELRNSHVDRVVATAGPVIRECSHANAAELPGFEEISPVISPDKQGRNANIRMLRNLRASECPLRRVRDIRRREARTPARARGETFGRATPPKSTCVISRKTGPITGLETGPI